MSWFYLKVTAQSAMSRDYFDHHHRPFSGQNFDERENCAAEGADDYDDHDEDEPVEKQIQPLDEMDQTSTQELLIHEDHRYLPCPRSMSSVVRMR